MTLREQLAAKYEAIVDNYRGHEGLWPGFADKMADECIRQMEWARRIGIKECEDAEDYSWGPYRAAMTIAPDDWEAPQKPSRAKNYPGPDPEGL